MVNEEFVAKQIPEFISLIADASKQIPDLKKCVLNLEKKAKERNHNDGISFLDMKIQLLLKYLIDITYGMVLKTEGLPLAGHPSIERLVEVRTVLEKIRPLEKKLQYQIEKLIKSATSADENTLSQHPLSFKPNIDNLVSRNKENEEEDDEESTQNNADVYVPPKVTAVHFDDDDKISKAEKKLEKSRQKSINNALLEDLREDYGDAPLEIQDSRNSNKRAKIKKLEDDRTRFEEDNLRRLTLTKKDKAMKRKLNELDEIVKLGSFRSLNNESSDDDMNYKPNIKKKKGKQSKKFRKRMQRKR